MKIRGIYKRGDAGQVDMWMVPYGTMMTIIMILFLVLWAYAYFSKNDMVKYEKVLSSVQKSVGAKVEKSEKEIAFAEKMNAMLQDKNLAGMAQLKISAKQIKMVLRTPVLFDLGSADLKPEIYPLLDEMSKWLKEVPAPVVIEGHTDDIPVNGGKYKSNFSLSSARAFNFVRYLIEKGAPPERLSIIGYGEYRPLYQNNSETNRALNRRIEICILRS
jgi:chemotaxis protein MotB